MKKGTFLTLLTLVSFFVSVSVIHATTTMTRSADPVVIEVVTKHTSISDALLAAKAALLKQKFILDGTMGETTFTAKRTTGSHADYYVADVTGKLDGGKTKLTISFVKVGTGLLKVQKMANAVKVELEK
ncbi:hypothetical protein [Niabella beijingensis]|uniref:hypothetical protein n=1 Tax=Niabella beijingensis TaxID=2872700 RepID=UPI001CC08907|nr:hypothetical protein [Niabella beijingensis]MBZ4192666.1 hypothetical protein [Niabella beijingensis]